MNTIQLSPESRKQVDAVSRVLATLPNDVAAMFFRRLVALLEKAKIGFAGTDAVSMNVPGLDELIASLGAQKELS